MFKDNKQGGVVSACEITNAIYRKPLICRHVRIILVINKYYNGN